MQVHASAPASIAAGEHHRVMSTGRAIRDSFIMKQSLTSQDKQTLMSVLPPEFVRLDRRFHGQAGKLAHAAESRDSELQLFYFNSMLESCVACHSRFASDTFPGLSEDSASGTHDH